MRACNLGGQHPGGVLDLSLVNPEAPDRRYVTGKCIFSSSTYQFCVFLHPAVLPGCPGLPGPLRHGVSASPWVYAMRAIPGAPERAESGELGSKR